MVLIEYGRYASFVERLPRRAEGEWVISVLAIPPDLAYACDGIRRLRAQMDADAATFAVLCDAGGVDGETVESLRGALDRVLVALEATFGHVARVTAPMERVIGKAKHPLQGFCLGLCPIWANLFCEPEADARDDDVDAYWRLQGLVNLHILAIHLRDRDGDYLERYSEWASTKKQPEPLKGSAPSRVAAASLAVRSLSSAAMDHVRHALTARDGSLFERAGFAETSLSVTRAKGSRSGGGDASGAAFVIDAFRRLHEEVFDTPAPTERGPRGAHSKASNRRLPYGNIRLAGDRLVAGVETLDDGSVLTQLFVTEPSDPDDGDGSSDTTSRCRLQLLRCAPPEGNQAPFARVAAERAARQLSRRQSGATYEANDLSDWQVKRLAAALAGKLPGVGHDLSPQAHLLAITLLATGRDPGTAAISFAAPPLPSDQAQSVVCSPGGWHLPVAPPAFADWDPDPQARPTRPWIVLPDVLGCSAIAEQHGMSRLPRDQAGLKRLRDEIGSWLATLFADPKASSRCLDAWLFRRLLDVGGQDVACATFITSRPMAHSRSSVHYTALRTEKVVAIYREAMAPLRRAFVAEANEPVVNETQWIGATRVPILEEVRRLVQGMRRVLTESTGIERRNALTAYTLLGLKLGTAARPSGQRTLFELQYLLRSAVLREKGTPYDERPVPLAPALLRQLRLYHGALRQAGMPPSAAFRLWTREGELGPTYGAGAFGEATAAAGFTLEPYALRRFVRTELCERGASGEDIDALMGHWHDLLSPHDPWSCYPLRRLTALARTVIATLLRDVGYEAMA